MNTHFHWHRRAHSRWQTEPRRGSSLIEIMVVLSVSSTLLVLAVGWIHQSFRLATAMRNHERNHQSLLRLSRQFREDAHLATSVSPVDAGVDFLFDDLTIRYRVGGNAVIRSLRKTTAEDVVGRESYQLATNSRLRFDVDSTAGWATLVVRRAGPPTKRNTDESNVPSDNTQNINPQIIEGFDEQSTTLTDLTVRAAVGRWRNAQTQRAGPETEETQP
ncbi:type II secretory pathway pseudopilin PulG [Rhodopirellula rubra]|uniref:Type II secretory pathway pseudopilin PulG n=1 Tax=Aporhodopirellula rubra TaxID=980271 RepID=A0A7W5DV64_9BACT|nr:hypothetical protein [Aporhodopirellula rubra]MBB3204257.1 type II secretory pathway pseudopilin PulG [Aporhodopirellula rubra]